MGTNLKNEIQGQKGKSKVTVFIRVRERKQSSPTGRGPKSGLAMSV